MLKKTERLSKKEFDQYFKTGRRFHSPLLTLIYHPNNRFHGATVVGKKVFKLAVSRNKLRRRLYNLLYQRKQADGLTGVFIVIANPTAKSATFTELKDATAKLLNQVDSSKQKS